MLVIALHHHEQRKARYAHGCSRDRSVVIVLFIFVVIGLARLVLVVGSIFFLSAVIIAFVVGSLPGPVLGRVAFLIIAVLMIAFRAEGRPCSGGPPSPSYPYALGTGRRANTKAGGSSAHDFQKRSHIKKEEIGLSS